jgi:NAD(P)H dehydrogenase (quinone)
MRIMVIFAHPLGDSFNAALHRTAANALRESGHEVDDCDLYAEGFDPVMSAKERRCYHDDPRNRAAVEGYVERLAAEALILLPSDVVFRATGDPEGAARSCADAGHIEHLGAVVTYGRPRYAALDGRPAAPHPDAVSVLADRHAGDADLSGTIPHDGVSEAQRQRFITRVDRAMRRFGR